MAWSFESARRTQVLAIALAMIASPGKFAVAHEGPPFPILVDVPAHNHLISVWGDPDVGEASFFVIVEPAGGATATTPSGVIMWTEPVSGRLPRAEVTARQMPLRNRIQFEANPHFDIQEFWHIGFRVTFPDGHTEELVAQVESTPPGMGRWDLLIYFAPFLLIGGLWVIGLLRRKGVAARGPAPVTSRRI